MSLRYILLLFIFVPFLLFGQYANNFISNFNYSFESFIGTPDDNATDNFDSWTETGTVSGRVEATVTAYSGSYALMLVDTAGGNEVTKLNLPTGSPNTTYRYEFFTRGDGVTAGRYYVYDYDNTQYLIPVTSTGISGTSYILYRDEFTSGPSPGDGYNFFQLFLYGGGTSNAKVYFDSVSLREKLDTLWISPAGNDADDDTVQTLTEAFVTRGAHSGGYFITLAGTYSESITIDSSFSRWEASGGNVTVTQVDFNSVTCTVDCRIYNNIGVIINAENVTVDNSMCARTREWKGWNKFKKW